MDLNLFATQTIQTGQKGSGNAALSGSGFFGGSNGLGATNVEFWNAILGNLAQDTGEAKADGGNAETNIANDKVKKETVDLALLQLALLGQDSEKTLDEKLADLKIERLGQNKNNRVEQLTKLIKHLTSGLPESSENGTVEELVERLTKRLEKLESRLEAFRTGDFGDDGAPFQALIATGLNPAQLTKITNRIEEVETKLGRELTVEDLIAGVGNIIPAPGDDEHEFSVADALSILVEKSEEQIASEKSGDKSNTEEEEQEFLATKSDLTLEQDNTESSIGNIPAEKTVNEHKSKGSGLLNLINRIASSDIIPQGIENAAQKQSLIENENAQQPIAEIVERLSNAEFNALFNSSKSVRGTLTRVSTPTAAIQSNTAVQTGAPTPNAPVNLFETSASAQNIISEALGFDIQTGTPFNATMQAAHATSASVQAGQSHPATQMVSAHITKAAQTGDTKNITLQLDPPELGRVEVKMEFGKDKTVKAHLIVEKPETYLMLQRDAASLERALQNAGLETDSGSLNYEMAAEDYAFNNNSQGGNGSANGGNSGSTEENTETIETTMTWDVDPETGHVHYSLLA